MSVFVESLRRLFRDNRIAENKIIKLFQDKKINEEECRYILGKDEEHE